MSGKSVPPMLPLPKDDSGDATELNRLLWEDALRIEQLIANNEQEYFDRIHNVVTPYNEQGPVACIYYVAMRVEDTTWSLQWQLINVEELKILRTHNVFVSPVKFQAIKDQVFHLEFLQTEGLN